MQRLTIDTGVKEYALNDAVTVYFNPTDIAFAMRVVDMFTILDDLQESYRKRMNDVKDTDKKLLYEITTEMEQRFREEIDGLFGTEVCDPLFGKVSIYAMSDGLPLWANLLFMIMDELDQAFIDERKKTNPRIQKYTAKYRHSR